MKQFYKPKVIMSIHGYNSNGAWQNLLTDCLNELGLISLPYNYGRKIFRILPHHINRDAETFRDWYFMNVDNPHNNLKIPEPFHRPSIVAHSLGTWILAKALVKYPELKFDKIFLFGSIIPADFDWFKLILRDQVNTVTYEKATNDKIVPMGFVFTGSLNPCGTNGFTQKSSFIKEESLQMFGHSTFQYKAHLKHYLEKRLHDIPHQLMVTAGRELDEKSVRRLFRETEKIDQFFYQDEYMENQIGSEKAIGWFRIEKDIWSFVLDVYRDMPVGYINAIPVNDDVYTKFCKGEILESDIKGADVLDYDTCDKYNLIILSTAIKRGVSNEETRLNKGRIAEMLIMSFIYKINQHNGSVNKLKKFAAFAWSDEGKKLYEGFCMTRTTEGETLHPLYEIDLQTLQWESIKNSNFMSRWWYQQLIG